MAIDTRAKRISMLNFGSISTDLLPDPDGSIGSEQRAGFIDLYFRALGGVVALLHRRVGFGMGFTHRDG